MGVTDYEHALAQAESNGSLESLLLLLKQIRKDKMRVPQVVADYGKRLLQGYKWRLGNERTWLFAHDKTMRIVVLTLSVALVVCVCETAVWTVYEQVFVASLELHDDELSEVRRSVGQAGGALMHGTDALSLSLCLYVS